MWALDDLSLILEVDLDDRPFDVTFLPGEKTAAVLVGGVKLLEVDLTTGELTEHGDMGPVHRGRINSGALSEDGSIAVCTGIPVKDITDIVEHAITRLPDTFSFSELQSLCPGVSRSLVRKILRRLRDQGVLHSEGTGRAARWRKGGTDVS